ncbi:MAG: LAGLIDADG family homing endonuclease [Candidatus Micrarchaeia archaeon]
MIQPDLSPITQKFEEFFTDKYSKEFQILKNLYPEKRSFYFSYKELHKYDHEFAEKLIDNPDAYLKAAELALISMAGEEKKNFEPHVRVEEVETAEKTVLIQDIGSEHIHKLVSVTGVVTKRAEIRPKVNVAIYNCTNCGNTEKVVMEKGVYIPDVCSNCRKRTLELDEKASKFMNIQRAEIQELLERVRSGSPASHIELFLDDDLCNTIIPGDTIEVVGIVRLRQVGKSKDPIYSKYIDVVSIRNTQREFEEVELTKEDIKKIQEFARQPNVFDIITNSIAPSIYGHREMKQAVALQLFGGNPDKILPEGGRIRSDIHILLIGDPGAAKTRMLQYVTSLAPKSIYVSGKSVSGVGLCVDKDSLITLNDAGMHKIGNYIENNWHEEMQEAEGVVSSPANTRVLTLNSNFKADFGVVEKFWKIQAPKRLIYFRTHRGKELKLTPNTPILVIDEGYLKWKKAGDLNGKEYIATSRRTQPLKGKLIPCISLLSNENIRIPTNISKIVKKITDKLAEKNKDLTEIAQRYGISRDRLYMWRSENHYQGIPLNLLKKMAHDAGMSDVEICNEIDEVFVRYGQNLKLPKFINPDIAYLAGLIAGDGNIYFEKNDKNSAQVRFHSTDHKLLMEASRIIKENFGLNTHLSESSDRIPSICVSSVVIAELLEKLGVPSGEKSHKIDIPPLLVSSGEECVKSFIRGLFDTDGYVSDSKVGSPSIGFTTTSKELAQKMILVLEWWGIVAKVRIRNKIGQKTRINNRTVETKKLQYQLEIRGIENLKQFRDEIGFFRNDKKEKLNSVINKSSQKANPNLDVVPVSLFIKDIKKKYCLKGMRLTYKKQPSRRKLFEIASRLPEIPEKKALIDLSNSDIYWDKIAEHKFVPSDSEWVYDLTVKNAHAFLANGIYVHNTASAEKDDLGEGWTLKAGALVLASGGLAAVDEFDKIDDTERAALHEVMESGTVSVAKAGIVAKFKAKTSILAAANPKFGRFDPNQLIAIQFDIPPTLQSRFDLIFPIRDVIDESSDRKLARYLLETHKNAAENIIPESKEEKVDTDFLRKYIAYARKNIKPKLSPEAQNRIESFYVQLREMGKRQGAVPITPRQIEGIIRLSEASAKSRLSEVVELRDAELAISLMEYVLKEIALDRSTGAINIDMIATGQPKSKQQQYYDLYGALRELSKQFDPIPKEKIYEEGINNLKLEERTIRMILDEMLKKGEIFEPKPGHFKIVHTYE